ncbi:MAG TPA: hypothetical protein VFX59_28890 [Polyangiales bacterium]|nr:hypothetical protein [Polyangiales bacterium]
MAEESAREIQQELVRVLAPVEQFLQLLGEHTHRGGAWRLPVPAVVESVRLVIRHA